ncbi:MAG TPA: outer membrane protein transport protein [Anaeromyxobacteraceae bacterium]|nr:outer membrane protein transport protein [Anaeromyxobacteraceae bacterium]
MRKAMCAVAAAIAFSAAPAWATNGIRMIGFGPVQDSMGGVSVGAPLDAASVLTNPAGMSQLGGRIDFGAAIFGATVKASSGIPGTAEVKSDRPPSPIPAFGLIIPINKDVNFGLGAYGIAGLGVDFAGLFGPSPSLSDVIHTSYSQIRFAPGLSWKLNDQFSVGATANLMYGALGLTFAGVSWPETSAFGFGATVGATYKLSSLTLGVAYESPGWFQDYKFDASGTTGVTGTPTSIAGVDKLKFNMPMSATIGGGYTISDLTIGVDVQWINWSAEFGKNQPKFTSIGSGFPVWASMGNSFDVNWKDQYVFKIGAQYDFKPVTVRVGYNYGSKIVDDTKDAQNIAFPAIAMHHITAGLGFAFSEKFALNVGGMYSPEVKQTSGPGLIPFQSTVKMTQWDANIGISYKM